MANDNDKKWKVHGLEKALKAVPAEDRAALAAEIENLLTNFDPNNPPGEPVRPLPPGTRTCPKCGSDLVELTVLSGGNGAEPFVSPLLLLDCEECEVGFCQTIDGQVQ